MLVPPRVKICCISSVEEARDAIRYGAAALGLVSHMPSGPGVIPEELIAEIAAFAPPPVATFLLTSSRDADAIAHQHAACRTSALQLVDSVEASELTRLRKKLPNVKLVQVIHVMGEPSIDEAKQIAEYVDALLLDSGNPTLAVKELGGTGRVHDGQISRQIREQVAVPVFLAGGLRATNVRDAIHAVEPFGLDLCSRVRVDGKLSIERLAELMRAVRAAVSPRPRPSLWRPALDACYLRRRAHSPSFADPHAPSDTAELDHLILPVKPRADGGGAT